MELWSDLETNLGDKDLAEVPVTANTWDDKTKPLKSDTVGLPGAIFVSVTTMAPAAGAAFSITVGAYFAGGALPLVVVVALFGCLFTALSLAQMARHLPSAGGMYTYIARGLGGFVGFVAGWAFNIGYVLILPMLAVMFGDLLGSTLHTEFHMNSRVWFVAGVAAVTLAVLVVNYFGIEMSTRFGLILGGLEAAVMIALACTLIAESHNTFQVFTTHFANIKGFTGLAGITAGSIFAVTAFIGFDSAAPIAEEARDPRRTVPRAVVGAAIAVGIYYVFTTYAAAVFFGPGRFGAFPAAGDGNPWNAMATSVWGAGWVVLFLALLNSSLACANSATCAATRCLYAMARIRVLPTAIGRVNRKHQTPHVAIFFAFIVGLVVALWLGDVYPPLTAYGVIGTIIAALLIPIYIAVDIACILYFWRERRREFNVLKHLLFPILGIVLFVPGFFATLGIPVFSFISPLAYPFSIAGPVTAVSYAVGVALAIFYSVKHPARIRDTAKVFLMSAPALSDTEGEQKQSTNWPQAQSSD